MDRFLSNSINKIDAKGRVSVPASFRTILHSSGLNELYALQSLDTPSIEAGGKGFLDRYEQHLSGIDPFQSATDDMSFYIYGDGAFLKFDTTGRITVSDFIRAHTGITDQVAFVGRGHFFQLWEPERFLAYRSDVRARLIAMRQSEKT